MAGISDNYSLLGITRHASDSDVRAAYKKMAMKTHPDKGGSEEKFIQIKNAYEKILKEREYKSFILPKSPERKEETKPSDVSAEDRLKFFMAYQSLFKSSFFTVPNPPSCPSSVPVPPSSYPLPKSVPVPPSSYPLPKSVPTPPSRPSSVPTPSSYPLPKSHSSVPIPPSAPVDPGFQFGGRTFRHTPFKYINITSGRVITVLNRKGFIYVNTMREGLAYLFCGPREAMVEFCKTYKIQLS